MRGNRSFYSYCIMYINIMSAISPIAYKTIIVIGKTGKLSLWGQGISWTCICITPPIQAFTDCHVCCHSPLLAAIMNSHDCDLGLLEFYHKYTGNARLLFDVCVRHKLILHEKKWELCDKPATLDFNQKLQHFIMRSLYVHRHQLHLISSYQTISPRS